MSTMTPPWQDYPLIPRLNGSFDIGSPSNKWGTLYVETVNAEIVVDQSLALSGHLYIGSTTLDSDVTTAVGPNPQLYILGTNNVSDSVVFNSNGANTAGVHLEALKTRSATGGNANTIVQNGDGLFSITAFGADGAAYQHAARIHITVDGVPGLGDMPGAIDFMTAADGGTTLVSALKLGNDKVASFGGNIAFTTSGLIRRNTSDGADNSFVIVTGGGGTGATRGGFLQVFGNETVNGGVTLATGDTASADITIQMNAASAGTVTFRNATVSLWQFNSAGNITQDASNGGQFIMSKASTAVVQPASATVSAAGTTVTDATQLTSVYNNVSTVAASTGVKVFDIGTGTNGYGISVVNSGTNNLKVYPPNASGTINGGSAGAGITITNTQIAVLFKVATNIWFALTATKSS